MALTYAQLLQAVQDYTANSEATFVSNIPVFVKQCEERVYNSVQIPAIRKSQTGTLTNGVQYLTLPDDWLATFELSIVSDAGTGARAFLLDKDVSFIREAYPVPTATGTPVYYAQFSSTSLILGPTPDASYACEIHYYYYPESIVTASSSWLGNNFENVLLYGTLREAANFMKEEPDIIANYDAKYVEGMALLKMLGDGKNRRDTYRNGQVRVPVT